MGKRFYCDFCDRSFADRGLNRKNHFKGLQHQRMKKQHYDNFRDAASILAEDSSKTPCKRFFMGSCDYGDGCKFSHMTPEKRQFLQQQVTNDKEEKERRLMLEGSEPTLEEWLEKRNKKLRKDNPSENRPDIHYELPPFLMHVPNLPPSLLPPTAEELINKPHCEWG
ncbi:zinc finger matrin-type protein 5-like [Ruditapes philippinarum]|uniref:zinc finger matrin-type protein 5-like n=1 Tax=Ruditapes philippinarum TaxID=129788 RepID=UPI00295C35FE|nr:zinc finger matrin-type protein 5-like [Ruditapes philippinarum]